jgi:hypothetical protein
MLTVLALAPDMIRRFDTLGEPDELLYPAFPVNVLVR